MRTESRFADRKRHEGPSGILLNWIKFRVHGGLPLGVDASYLESRRLISIFRKESIGIEDWIVKLNMSSNAF